jgi:hypothetical protein
VWWRNRANRSQPNPLVASSLELVARDWVLACGFTIKADGAGRVVMTGRIDDSSRELSPNLRMSPCKSGDIHRCDQQKASDTLFFCASAR